MRAKALVAAVVSTMMVPLAAWLGITGALHHETFYTIWGFVWMCVFAASATVAWMFWWDER